MAKKAKTAKNIPGVTCLSLGRQLSMAECGLTYAANGIIGGDVARLNMGMITVFKSMSYVSQMLGGNKLAGEILNKANFIQRNIETKKKIPASKSKQMLEDVQKMKVDIDRLFSAGASVCSGKK